MDREQIKKALAEVLDARNSIDADDHRLHHNWLRDEIDRRRESKERWEKVRTHVYGWGAVTAVGGIVYMLGEGVKQFFIGLFKLKGGQ